MLVCPFFSKMTARNLDYQPLHLYYESTRECEEFFGNIFRWEAAVVTNLNVG